MATTTRQSRWQRTLWPLGALLAALAAAGCGGGKGARLESRTYALGVNGYLWRASLDTLAFMPMTQADGKSGIILTDWYVNPDTPSERLKVSVYILDTALRADALSVHVFREVMQDGRWIAAPVRAGTVEKLEDAILNRARLLRVGNTAG
ncbi:MAG: DUF3576 domain-containing protein [Alphaproteobacteria bacterium]|nr:MAG: DUF3576 domain-containing protein [Alphaproteobacteria bacterium]